MGDVKIGLCPGMWVFTKYIISSSGWCLYHCRKHCSRELPYFLVSDGFFRAIIYPKSCIQATSEIWRTKLWLVSWGCFLPTLPSSADSRLPTTFLMAPIFPHPSQKISFNVFWIRRKPGKQVNKLTVWSSTENQVPHNESEWVSGYKSVLPSSGLFVRQGLISLRFWSRRERSELINLAVEFYII